MAWYIIIGTLCAWGLLCAVWVCCSRLLRADRDSMLLLCAPGGAAEDAILRYRLLQGMGLVCGPLLIVGSDLPPEKQAVLMRKYPGVEFCSAEELSSRLEWERK
jgi:hypothetical protein